MKLRPPFRNLSCARSINWNGLLNEFFFFFSDYVAWEIVWLQHKSKGASFTGGKCKQLTFISVKIMYRTKQDLLLRWDFSISLSLPSVTQIELDSFDSGRLWKVVTPHFHFSSNTKVNLIYFSYQVFSLIKIQINDFFFYLMIIWAIY